MLAKCQQAYDGDDDGEAEAGADESGERDEVEASGGHVHFAVDAEEARAIILKLCRDVGATTVTTADGIDSIDAEGAADGVALAIAATGAPFAVTFEPVAPAGTGW